MSTPAIAVLPYGLRLGSGLAQVALSELIWPLGSPDHLAGGRIGDLDRDDHLISFPSTDSHFQLRRGTRARVSLILSEPSVIHAKHLALLRLSHRRFFRVLTFNEELLARIPNGVFFPRGTTRVPDWRDLTLEKTKMCSLIASPKRESTGHKLRHAVAKWVQGRDLDVDITGRGHAPIEQKFDGLAPYRFSVVMEDAQEANYFSHKLVDAVLCDTVPIYWGCPNLERFFDVSGIIQCASEADVRQAIERASETVYARHLPGLQAIKPVLEGYCDLERRAAIAVRDSL
ncbi:MAG: hypothetical protein AB8B51_18460 [Sedimentitalea sp.]